MRNQKIKLKKKAVIEVIDIEAECFIIPNRAGLVDSFMEMDQKDLRNLIRLNGLDVSDESHLMVQFWLTNKAGLNSSNLFDHWFNVNNKTCGFRDVIFKFLPNRLFQDVKEGGKVKVRIPGWIIDEEFGKQKRDVIFDITMTCSQNKYRYSDFGPFEKCLEMVCQSR